MDKLYWSEAWASESWNESQWMTFFLIPNKWWSISEWKLAFEFRAEALKKIMAVMNSEAGEKKGRDGE